MKKPYLGVYEHMEFPEYQFREYPKMVHVKSPETGKVEERVVHNRAEELRAIDEIVQVKTYDAVVKEKEELQAKLKLLEAQSAALSPPDKSSLLDPVEPVVGKKEEEKKK